MFVCVRLTVYGARCRHSLLGHPGYTSFATAPVTRVTPLTHLHHQDAAHDAVMVLPRQQLAVAHALRGGEAAGVAAVVAAADAAVVICVCCVSSRVLVCVLVCMCVRRVHLR